MNDDMNAGMGHSLNNGGLEERKDAEEDAPGSRIGPWQTNEFCLANGDELNRDRIVEVNVAKSMTSRLRDVTAAHDFLASFGIDIIKPQ